VRLPLALLGTDEVETLWGAGIEIRDGDAVLPAGGPAFHAWRLGATRREDD
jgi:hypothetical protein